MSEEEKKRTLALNISVLLPVELVEYLDQIASINEASRGWALRKVIREHKKAKKGKK